MTEGIELPNQEIITLGEKETCKYLKILEADTIKQVEMKEKKNEKYLSRTRKLLDTNKRAEILSKLETPELSPS